jgi:transcriptional regulator with XRE-family HTH domain
LERLRYIREQAGYSQQNLADESGVSQHTISEIELGRRKPQGRTLRKLANVLHVEVRDFYGETDHPKGEAPPWLEPSFNDVLEERRFFRFADAFDAAADRWIARVTDSKTADEELSGLMAAVLDLYQSISKHITRREWERLTTEEQAELSSVMDKLAKVAADGLLRLQDSGYLDEQTVTLRREMMREWNRISA